MPIHKRGFRMSRRLITAGALLGLSLSNCAKDNNEDISLAIQNKVDSAALASRTGAIVADLVNQSVAAFDEVQNWDKINAAGQALDKLLNAVTPPASESSPETPPEMAPTEPPPADDSRPIPEEKPTEPPMEVPVEITDDNSPAQARADDIAEFLRERIFADANLESEQLGVATYLLHGATFCDADSEATARENCIANIDSLQLRVTVAEDTVAGGFALALLVGPDHLHPMDLKLGDSPSTAALTADLGELKRCAEFAANVLHDDAILDTLPQVLAGRIQASIQTDAEHIQFDAAVLEPLRVEVAQESGTLALALEESLWGAALERVERNFNFSIAMGSLDVMLPYSMLHDESTDSSRVVSGHLAGASGNVALHDSDTDALSLTHLGLGDHRSTISIDNQEIVSLELNADVGRIFDLHLNPQGEGDARTVQSTFSPAFILSLALQLESIAEDLNIPEWARSNIFKVILTSVSEGGWPSLTPLQEALRVDVGQLILASSQHPESDVSVGGGQCLTSQSELREGSAAPWGYFSAGTCE